MKNDIIKNECLIKISACVCGKNPEGELFQMFTCPNCGEKGPPMEEDIDMFENGDIPRRYKNKWENKRRRSWNEYIEKEKKLIEKYQRRF